MEGVKLFLVFRTFHGAIHGSLTAKGALSVFVFVVNGVEFMFKDIVVSVVKGIVANVNSTLC